MRLFNAVQQLQRPSQPRHVSQQRLRSLDLLKLSNAMLKPPETPSGTTVVCPTDRQYDRRTNRARLRAREALKKSTRCHRCRYIHSARTKTLSGCPFSLLSCSYKIICYKQRNPKTNFRMYGPEKPPRSEFRAGSPNPPLKHN